LRRVRALGGCQVAAVRAALESAEEFRNVPVTAVPCFIDGEFPLFGTIEIAGIAVRGLGGTTKLVATEGRSIWRRAPALPNIWPRNSASGCYGVRAGHGGRGGTPCLLG
jgi:hypothetical protein